MDIQTSKNNALVIGKAKTGTTVLATMIKNALRPEIDVTKHQDNVEKSEPSRLAAPLLKLQNYVESGHWEIKNATQQNFEFNHSNPALCMEPKGIATILRAQQDGLPFTVKIIFEHFADKLRQLDALVHNELDINFEKLIFIRRDIRDEMVSRLMYLSKAMVANDPPKQNWEKWIEILEIKENNPSSLSFFEMAEQFERIFGANAWDDIVKRHTNTDNLFTNFIKERVKRDHIVINYEDMVDGKLDGLSNYMGHAFDSDLSKVDLGKFAYTKRTADHGRWKQVFLPSDVDRVRTILKDKGLNAYPDWTLEPVPSLNPEEYSVYVRRLSGVFDATDAQKASANLVRDDRTELNTLPFYSHVQNFL